MRQMRVPSEHPLIDKGFFVNERVNHFTFPRLIGAF